MIDITSRECRYCGKQAFGYGCLFSPSKLHVSVGGNDECVYCGSTSYGHGCVYHTEINKTKDDGLGDLHVHGHGKSQDGKSHCIYCGLSNVHGYGCLFSKDNKHHF